MKKLSNNGQSLVIFAVFLPFIIMLLAFIIDYGMLKISKNRLDSINKMTLKYGMKNINNNPKEKMDNLIKTNDNDITRYDIDINEENKSIRLTLNKKINSFSYKIIKKEEYDLKSVYEGYIKDNKIIIERGN